MSTFGDTPRQAMEKSERMVGFDMAYLDGPVVFVRGESGTVMSLSADAFLQMSSKLSATYFLKLMEDRARVKN